jgi:hypothetical protein
MIINKITDLNNNNDHSYITHIDYAYKKIGSLYNVINQIIKHAGTYHYAFLNQVFY